MAFKQFQNVLNLVLNIHKYARWRMGKIKIGENKDICQTEITIDACEIFNKMI